MGIADGADIAAIHYPILEFREEIHRIFRISGEGVGPAAGGQIAIEIFIIPHQLRHPAIRDLSGGVGVANLFVVIRRNFAPKHLRMSQKLQFWKLFQNFLFFNKIKIYFNNTLFLEFYK